MQENDNQVLPGTTQTAASSDVGASPSASTATTGSQAIESARKLAIAAALAGQEKKATHIQIIDLEGRVDYADFLVVMTGSSDRNVAAIAQGVEGDLEKQGHRALAVEGLPSAEWVLIDLFDVVVHVFQADWRQEYDLDGLWADAPRVAFP